MALLLAQGRPEKVPTIRVLIQGGVSAVTLKCKGPVELVKPGWPRPVLSFLKLPATPLVLKEGRFEFAGMNFDEKWLIFRARDGLQVGGRTYPGEIHCVAGSREFQVVNEVDMEQYVRGVVPAEIGSGAPLEAMKVQAVVARSYAVARMGGFREEKSRPVYDVVDDTRDQVYGGIPAANTNLLRACEATAGMYVQYKGKTVCTYFSSSCGGHTLDVQEWGGTGAIPPLSGVPCGFCGENAPNGSWEARVTTSQVAQRLAPRIGARQVLRASVFERTKSNRVGTVLVEHAGGQLKVPGDEFARAAGARNTNFTLRQEGEILHLRGTGYGHGVGLCQVGALAMGAKGKSFREILAHYFPQHELAVLYGPLRRK